MSAKVIDSTPKLIAENAVANEHLLDDFLATVERRALRIAQIATRDRDEALDLVQDAMLSLACSYGLRPAAEWSPLFHRILNNRIRDWQRRRSVKNRLMFWRDVPLEEAPQAALVERIVDPGPAADTQLRQAQAMKKLEAALRLLPGRQRQAFILRIWEGLNVEQTARAMACSSGSVKTHLSRALASLRQYLDGVWP